MTTKRKDTSRMGQPPRYGEPMVQVSCFLTKGDRDYLKAHATKRKWGEGSIRSVGEGIHFTVEKAMLCDEMLKMIGVEKGEDAIPTLQKWVDGMAS